MKKKNDHGLHNYRACDLLIATGKGEFNDWVITTAFYSALHLVHDQIFPMPVRRRVYESFEAFYNNQYPNNDLAKHTVTKDLVKEYPPEISSKYDWLFKQCYNARYKQYNVESQIAQTAKHYLDLIKNHSYHE